MRRLLALIVAVLACATLAPGALASSPATLTTIDLAPRSDPELATAGTHAKFTLVGLHWRGPGRVAFRTRSLAGRWSAWRPAAPEDEDQPDYGSAEAGRTAGWRIGNPWWAGPSDRVEVRKLGRVTRVRAYLVWSPEIRVPLRMPAATRTPPIMPRSSWGADESIRRARPSYATALRFAVVHHTAGRNGYTRADAAAIVRGIQLFHVQGNGWNDIGYNFLIDRFGTIYEGRFGGIERDVVGAHAQGFNTGSTGIALIGSYGDTAPSRAAQDALAELLAWRLDLAHVDPLGVLTALSGGNERFVADVPVLLRAVSGHRDTGFTECPGNALYSRLAALAAVAARIGGPKIFEPRIDASAEGPVRFRARLSASLPWTVSITGTGAGEVARGAGTGTKIDWTWDATAAAPATYSWSMEAGSARPAAGSLRAGLASATLAVEAVAAEPEAITPNGDGQADVSAVTFKLTTPANVTVEVADEFGGVVATVVDRVWTRAGQHTIEVDGGALADGRYTIVVRARAATGSEVTEAVPLIVSRTLGLVTVTPTVFSPNGDGRRDRLDIRFDLAAPATVRVRVLRGDMWIASPLIANLGIGPQRVVWDGSTRFGTVRDGSYLAVVETTDAIGTVSFGVPFVSDTAAPRVRFLRGRSLRIAVSEPALLKVWINGESVNREVKRAGIVLIRWGSPVLRARAVAWDAAGNVSGPAMWRPGSQRHGQ
jgi:N-acetylmuramoyl-L-alanine amidase